VLHEGGFSSFHSVASREQHHSPRSSCKDERALGTSSTASLLFVILYTARSVCGTLEELLFSAISDVSFAAPCRPVLRWSREAGKTDLEIYRGPQATTRFVAANLEKLITFQLLSSWVGAS
jgi:hypothetical protein